MDVRGFSQGFRSAVQRSIDKQFTKMEKIQRNLEKWIHKHPTTMKVLMIGSAILGAAAIATLPLSLPVIGSGAIALAVVGGIVAAISILAYNILDVLVAPSHPMEHHAFKPASCEGGRLYYQGHVPVLELESNDPSRAGFAHGFLMGPYIAKIVGRMDFLKKLSPAMPQADQLPLVLTEIRNQLPADYVTEMEGIVAGFNKWAEQGKWFSARKITFEELLQLHMMPDMMHFSLQRTEEHLRNKVHPLPESQKQPQEIASAVACTVIADRDPKNGITFVRNMDWASFGLFGTYSLVINRKYSNGKPSTAEVGMPGFAGTLTGMNSEGLSIAMNVCSGKTKMVNGMPAAFFNRLCLEKCSNVKDVAALIEMREFLPLGSYHLSTADANEARAFHLHQNRDGSHYERTLGDDPLIVTNFNYRSDGTREIDVCASEARHQILDQYYTFAKDDIPAENYDRQELAAAALALPIVNNNLTTHTVVMQPSSKKMKVAFDNAYSASAELQEVDTAKLFG